MPRKPGGTYTKVTHAKKVQIAAGKVLGHSQAQIALQTGVSYSTVSHFRDESLIQKLKAKYEDRLDKLFQLALEGMLADVKAKDPDVRIKTRSQIIRAISAGDFAPSKFDPPSDGGGEFELQELMVAHYSRKVTR